MISPPWPPLGLTLVMKTSFMVRTKKSFWPSPALRAVSLASLKCLPDAHCLARTGEALSYVWVKTKSPGLAFPLPEPPPVGLALWLTFQLHDSTSISPLWSLWVDSPSTPSNFMCESVDMRVLLFVWMNAGVESDRRRDGRQAAFADGSFETRRRETVSPSSW